MATLNRRVQVLLDPRQYAELEAEAAAERHSVAALIREAIDERLDKRKLTRRDAVERLLAGADTSGPPIDWQAEKDSFDRGYLRDLP